MIDKAEKSIQIFTPYLDFTINKLIENAEDHINVTIITALEGDSLFQRGYQLNALQKAITNGVTVKNLIGLHAKVLLIDNQFVSLGSQNFTNRGRKNKEAGIVSQASFEGSELLSTLKIWESESIDVNLELLEELSSFLDKNEEAVSKIKKKFDRNVEKIISDFNQREIERQIANSTYFNSTYRFAQGEVILTRTIPPPNYDYFSFFAEEHNNLCKWTKTTAKGREEQVDLEDYNYYPALNVKTMQMAFLRIHTSRITFMKSEFNLNQWNSYEIGKLKFELDFSFLKSKTKVSNIKVSLKSDSIGKALLYYLFNGSDFLLVKTKYNNDSIERVINDDLLLKKKKHNEFLKFLVEPAKFTTHWDQPKEIEKFLPEYSYRVGILEYNNYPILIFNKR